MNNCQFRYDISQNNKRSISTKNDGIILAPCLCSQCNEEIEKTCLIFTPFSSRMTQNQFIQILLFISIGLAAGYFYVKDKTQSLKE